MGGGHCLGYDSALWARRIVRIYAGSRQFNRKAKREDVMTKRLITWMVGLLILTLTVTACGTLTGAAVGAGGGAAIGAGTVAPARARSSAPG